MYFVTTTIFIRIGYQSNNKKNFLYTMIIKDQVALTTRKKKVKLSLRVRKRVYWLSSRAGEFSVMANS